MLYGLKTDKKPGVYRKEIVRGQLYIHVTVHRNKFLLITNQKH
jgi:hypothetical protein